MEVQDTGTTVQFDMNGWALSYYIIYVAFSDLSLADIKDTMIVLMTVASLLALTSLTFSISLLYDWIRHLLHQKSTSIQEKLNYLEQLDIQCAAFLTRTLSLQALVLSFLNVTIFAVFVPSTLFSLTHSANLTIQGFIGLPDVELITSIRYWDYPFCEPS